MEDFNDQPNGICLECWAKTEEFDKFYKSVQAAHLILLNSKYPEANDESFEVKNELLSNDDILTCADSTAGNPTYDYGHLDQDDDDQQDTDGSSNLISFLRF